MGILRHRIGRKRYAHSVTDGLRVGESDAVNLIHPGIYPVSGTDGIRMGDSAVGVLAGPAALYPNKPPSFGTTREINFSQAVPGGIGGGRAIAGGPWSITYDANYGGSSSAEPTSGESGAPGSPPTAWRMHWVPGTFSESHGIGIIYTNVASLGITSLYCSLHFKFSAGYPWHPISNKFLWWEPGNFLLQSKGGPWLHHQNGPGGQWLDPGDGPLNGATLHTYNVGPITDGVYHQIESILDRSAGTWKTWLDGVLVLHASGLNVTGGSTFQEFLLEAYRGGGGETLSEHCYNYWDHLHLAWA